MPRSYTRKTSRGQWTRAAMYAALEDVQQGKSTLKASKDHGVPRSSLQRRLSGQCPLKAPLGPRKPVFTPQQERQLKNHIIEMERMFFGLTQTDARRLAFQYAEKNRLNHRFKNGIAGKDWLISFLKRNKDLSLRTPEATSAARAKGFNKEVVSKFFDILVEAGKSVKGPHVVYNVDETGITTVQSKPSRVLAQKGRKQVGSLTSAERGELTTAVVCMSAVGNFVPPMMILPRARVNKNLEEGAPPGTVFEYHPSGWMQTDIFTRWFQHFIRHAKPSAEEPALLILDGHMTHTRNLDVIEMARANHVTIVVIPPHTSHRLQPLDVGFMKPLNTFYVQAIEKFLRQNPGRVVTLYQIARLFGEAYLKAATPATAINAFKKCGIFPIDMDVFAEEDFSPSDVTHPVRPSTLAAEEEASSLLDEPTAGPSGLQASETTAGPSGLQASEPTAGPSGLQASEPTAGPSGLQASEPTAGPSGLQPSETTAGPSGLQASEPTAGPSGLQASEPTAGPSGLQASETTAGPSGLQASETTAGPSGLQASEPTAGPSGLQASETTAGPSGLQPSETTAGPSGLQASETTAGTTSEIRPCDILPLPRANLPATSAGARRRTTPVAGPAILTSSPVKRALENSLTKRKPTQSKKKRTKACRKGSGKERGACAAEAVVPCLYCGESFGDSVAGEGWACCTCCKKWAHDECAGLDDNDANYVCEFCAP
ncbi:uncharacterized protein LOC122384902 [Amphibalanus amphitrite]|uniref:uncharacterized protein LOC122384902 n=1 Tax=Amphibalanus amphitrite TaxID=1232801 RepID=UPI001C91493F|nr:uncharacterized protein LOC122384902 [Amphibalanus amphitrite]